MAPQLDYDDMVAAVKGGLADAGHNDIISGVSDEIIQMGIGIQVETSGLITLPSAAGDQFFGIVLQKHKAQTNALNLAQYEIGQAIPILKKGRIWVYSEEAINPVDPVFLRHTADDPLFPGDFRTDLDTDEAFDISAWAKWVSVTTAAGLAILEVNFP